MNEEYKQIECISKMKKEYFDKFCTIVEGYREKISDNLVIGDSAFTLHDFDHHCFDIYKIISEVLFDEELVYSEKYGLSERELYIMNLANDCLLLYRVHLTFQYHEKVLLNS